MANRTSGFLSSFNIDFGSMAPDDVDRDDGGNVLVSGSGIQAYKSAGTDAVATAATKFCQTQFTDLVGNTFVANSPSLNATHKAIESQLSLNLARTLLENSADTNTTVDAAINKIYKTVVIDGLAKYFQVPLFNEVGGVPPPGFATLITTQIVVPPQPPPRISVKSEYDDFSGPGDTLLGQMFDEFLKAVTTQTQLLHQGVTPAGPPITLPDKVLSLV